MNKIYPNAETALDGLLKDGLLIASGGFGLCGIPERLLAAVRSQRRQGSDLRQQQCRYRQ